MRQCTKCYMLLLKIENAMNDGDHEEAIKYTEELLEVFKNI